MTDTLYKPEETGARATRPTREGVPRRDRLIPAGCGNGPVLAAGMMVGGAALLAGWGMAQILIADERPSDETAAIPAHEGREEGGPDREASPGGATEDPSATGKGDEDQDGDQTGLTPPNSEPTGRTWVYVIAWGDTLTAISGETGVPIGILVEKNRIQNPNLIYAGASLLIPPTR